MTNPASAGPALGAQPSVAIIIRVMDRADEVRTSLQSLLTQDYANYHVVIVDHSSEDGLDAILASANSSRLKVVRVPRPEHFNRSLASNIGTRYSSSDLLFFLDTGISFRDERHLTEIVASYVAGTEIDPTHYTRWRAELRLPLLESLEVARSGERRVYCECECHGLHLLMSRQAFQDIGGLNEALHDWGYEDTDLSLRLELCGYGRIPIRGLVERTHDDAMRVRFHREKSRQLSWERNRRISDGSIKAFGPVLKTLATPGATTRVEIDGTWHDGRTAPQQSWTMETAGEWWTRRHAERDSVAGETTGPIVSVVVPTRNAAEYLVGVLDSILSQDYPHIECFVVDAGSTDATLDILASYGDRIRWVSKPDRGAFDAINRGWLMSDGTILAWLNADDRWTPGAVSAAVRCFEKDPSADLIYGDCLIVDGDDVVLEDRRPPDWNLAYAVETCHHMIDQPAMFIRRSMAQRIGWLYPAWFHDWELWRRVSLAGGRITRVPYLLGAARVRRDNSQYRPDILITGLVNLTKRFFSIPGLPADVVHLRKRALSNCYLRIAQTLEYGRPENRSIRRRLCLRALFADWSNFRNVLNVDPQGGRPLPISMLGDETVDDAA